MSIFKDVKDLAEGKTQSKDWYRSQLYYGLEDYTGGVTPGDIITFNYNAANPRGNLPWYDRFPLVQISDLDTPTGQFSGGNVHYLAPSVRKGICESWADGGQAYPARCHHKYFISNCSNVKVVPRIELRDMTPLPIEQFVFNVLGRWVDVPSNHIWSRL